MCSDPTTEQELISEKKYMYNYKLKVRILIPSKYTRNKINKYPGSVMS